MRRLNTLTLPVCPCGKSTKIVTSWISRNPGRRYAVCVDEGCDFWDWIDREMCRRSIEVIPDLLKKVNATEQQRDELQTVLTKLEPKVAKLKVKVKEMKHELARQKHIRKWLLKLLVLSWVLILLMVVWPQDERWTFGMLQIEEAP